MSYWHKALEPLDGQDVMCCVDQHDPSSIIVRTLVDDVYICHAVLNGNKHDAFPKSLVEIKREQRANRRLKKLEDEARKAQLEKKPTLLIEHDETLKDLMGVHQNVIEHNDELVMFACDVKAG